MRAAHTTPAVRQIRHTNAVRPQSVLFSLAPLSHLRTRGHATQREGEMGKVAEASSLWPRAKGRGRARAQSSLCPSAQHNVEQRQLRAPGMHLTYSSSTRHSEPAACFPLRLVSQPHVSSTGTRASLALFLLPSTRPWRGLHDAERQQRQHVSAHRKAREKERERERDTPSTDAVPLRTAWFL